MDLTIVTVYCICDDIIKSRVIQNNQQSLMTLAEVMTVGIVAALFHRGNIQNARMHLHLSHYMPHMLSHSRLNRRLLAIDQDVWQAVLVICNTLMSSEKSSNDFVIDSCPILACHPCRSWRCKLYQGKEYLGYCAAKHLHYYGLKIHIIVSVDGAIVELLFTPASVADITALKQMNIDLPEKSYLYGDRAYASSKFEEELHIDANVHLVAQKKRKSKRPLRGPLAFLQKIHRRVVETVFSQITRFMGRSIVARSRKGFELRVFWFILAYSIERVAKI